MRIAFRVTSRSLAASLLAFAVACTGGPDTPDPQQPPPQPGQVLVIHESRHDTTSLPLWKTPAAPRLAPHEDDEGPVKVPIKTVPGQSAAMLDPVAQRGLVQHPNIPNTQRSFEGVGEGFVGPAGTFNVASAPPDTNGAVGPNHFVQVVNTDLAIFDKTGTVLLGPVPINTVFAGFGGACQNTNDGDPIVQYDQFSDRWIISQFSVSAPPFQQCVAVSTSGDPLGTYNRYAFSFGNTDFNDYPKIGIWPDGYYFTFNIFANGASFSGAQACAYDRASMLTGATASAQCFSTGPNFGGLLPASADGATPPPAGAPNYLLNFDANSLNLWKFHVDFANPASSTFEGPTNLPVAPFNAMCGGSTCIPQGGGGGLLDSLSDRLMYRLAYRNFGDHESLVVNHTVDAGGGVAGVRWYELRDPATTLTVFQQGTFAPDSKHRWMGSAAMDKAGDIAIGYSSSSSASFPDIRYSGRLADDELGTMTQGEGLLFTGTGAQTGGLNRWGDYSSLVLDPSNDCTFWYTTEYLATSGSFNWHTRIGSFTFPACSGVVADEFSMSASPTSATVTGGESASYTIATALTSGSVQAINLSVSGLPPGASATFDTASIFSGETATLFVSTSSSTPVGTYSLSIVGTGTASTATTTVTLAVTPVINTSLTNGNFETGDLTGWIVGPNASIVSSAHGGAFAAQVGSVSPFLGDSSISQAFPIPAGAASLSFFYNISCPDTVFFDWATATLTDFDTGITTEILPRTCTNFQGWQQASVDVSGMVGHTVLLTLLSHDDNFSSDPTFVLYDDVKLEGPPVPPSTITNGDFETGDFTAWTQTGTSSIDTTVVNGGSFSALVGALTPTNGDSTVQQTFTVPAAGGTLSFFYQVHCNDVLDLGWANASLTDHNTGVTTALLTNTCKNLGVWVKVSTDLSALAGHTVTLTLLNHDDNYPGDATFTYFDDVSFTDASAPPPVIGNGDFETGDLSSWTTEGSASITTNAHGGGFAAVVGAFSATWGDSVVEQSFVVPATAGTLAFFYQSHCADLVQYDWTTATLTDHTTGTTQVLLGKTCKNTGAWVQVSSSLTGLAGHYVTLSLVNHDDNYDADVTYSVFDDVTLQ
jgi:hypothetical protein